MSQLTIGSACATLVSGIENDTFTTIGMTSDNLADIGYAVSHNKVVRDYLLGFPLHYGMEKSADYVRYLIQRVSQDERAGFYSVLSAYEYEQENKPRAFELLALALEIDPEYAFAHLLARVFRAGWAGGELASMRSELDPQVRAQVEEVKDYPVDKE